MQKIRAFQRGLTSSNPKEPEELQRIANALEHIAVLMDAYVKKQYPELDGDAPEPKKAEATHSQTERRRPNLGTMA